MVCSRGLSRRNAKGPTGRKEKIKMVDLNDRDYADQTTRTPFFPRADAYYKIQPLEFEEYESESRVGWIFRVSILEVETGKEDPLFEPPAMVGHEYEIRFNRIDPISFRIKSQLFELRQMLAALMGVDHSSEFDANKPLATMIKMQALADLDPIMLHVDAFKSKPKEDPENPNGPPLVFVNTNNIFTPCK